MRARALKEVSRRLPPGIPGRVLLSVGANDCVHERGQPRVALPESCGHLRALLVALTACWPTLVIGPPPFSLPAQPGLREALHALTHAYGYGEVCGSLGVPWLPLSDALAGDPEWSAAQAAGDGVHPTAAGYARLAAVIGAWPGWQAWLQG